MNISLSSELEKYVQSKVSSGMYTSASEVIRESLRLMRAYDDVQRKQLYKLNAEIEKGLSQLWNGQRVEGQESYKKMKSKLDKLSKE